jgi:hypothetical protein
MVGMSTLQTRRLHRHIQIRIEKLGGTAPSPNTATNHSAVGALAALLVEWKLAEQERAGGSCCPQECIGKIALWAGLGSSRC